MSRIGAIAGMLVGGLTVVVWGQLSGGLFDVYEILPAVIFALAVIFIGSKLFPDDASRQVFQRMMR